MMNNTATLNLNEMVESGIISYQDNIKEIGGAIFADSSNITISGCATFVNNSAKLSGGALATVNNSTLIIDGSFCDHPETTDTNKGRNVVFDRNKVTTAASSGSEFNDITVHDSYTGSGGAIYAENGKVSISNAVFIDNY